MDYTLICLAALYIVGKLVCNLRLVTTADTLDKYAERYETDLESALEDYYDNM